MDNKCVEKLLETVAFSNGCICSVELIRWEHTHFHPSGRVVPSRADLLNKDKVKGALDLVGLELLDYMVLGNGYYSAKEQEVL